MVNYRCFEHFFRLGALLTSKPEATSCVASVPVRAERNIGPREGVCHIRAAQNGARAAKLRDSSFALTQCRISLRKVKKKEVLLEGEVTVSG